MELLARIQHHFAVSSATRQQALAAAGPAIVQAAERIAHCLTCQGKVLVCGNGGSAADAQHFASEMLNRFEIERLGLPVLALTTDTSTLTSVANDSAFEAVFARQVHALGQGGDVLFTISTSGNSPNIIAAIQAAQKRGMLHIALNGREGGVLPVYWENTMWKFVFQVPPQPVFRKFISWSYTAFVT